MKETNKIRKISNKIRLFLILCIFESLIVLAIYFFIPSDPKTAWLLGYSRSRWLMIIPVISLLVFFSTGIFLIAHNNKRKILEKIFNRIISHPQILNGFRVIGFLIIFIFIIVTSIHFDVYTRSYSADNTFINRINPLLILGEVLCIQFLVFLIYLNQLFFSFSWLESFINIYYLPILQKISYLTNYLFNFIENNLEKLERKVNRPFLIGAIIATPILMSTFLIYIFFGSSIFDYTPVGSDEMIYWRETLTFIKVGFNGGQYSSNELVALIEYSHFEAHGPAFPVFYGLLGNLFGWQYFSGVIYNHILLSIGLLIFIYLTKPNNQKLMLLWLLLITFWPIWLYLPTSRVEGIFFVFSAIFAGLFYKIIIQEKKKALDIIALYLFILFAGLFRSPWAFLFIPFFYILFPDLKWKNTIKILMFAGISIGFVLLFFKYYVTDYPDFAHKFILSLGSSDFYALEEFIDHFFQNVLNYFSVGDNQLFVLLRYQLLWILIVSLVDYFNFIRNPDKSSSKHIFSFFTLSNLGVTILFTIIAHTVHAGREFRLWSPHLLLSLFILIFSSRQRLVVGIIVTNIVFSISFSNTFISMRTENYTRDNSDILLFEEAVSDFLIYEPVDNHWCNTIDISRFSNQKTWGPWILTLPEEFGVTWIMNWELFHRKPLKAKYVLLDPIYIEKEYWLPIMEDLNLELLTETPIGNLYFNLDSNCTR